MTKGDKELAWVFGGAGALLLVYLFWPKTVAAQAPAAPVPAVSIPGAVVPVASQAVQTLPTPTSGSITFVLPTGAISWGLTSYRRVDGSEGPLAVNPSTAPITTSAAKGDTFTLYWITPTVDAYSAVYTMS